MLEAIGHYRILRKLGEGGMGVVYAAEDERLGRTVAIKMIHEASADPQARERLRREARSAASVNHPNICQIYDVGELEGEPYLVMELMEGEPLASRISRGPLALGEATPIGLGILTALSALHNRGVLHRDLKPSNVFLTPHGVKVLDFGLARVSKAEAAMAVGGEAGMAERSLTMPGTVIGTPRYMSPEQLRGDEIDRRADLFAAGAILFEMLAGRPAFGGALGEASPVSIYHAVLYEQPPALAGSAAIAAVNRIIFRAVAKRQAERYETAEAMAEDLRAILMAPDAGAKVSARPMTRLIVLPFRLLKPDHEIEYLSLSLAEVITASLTGLESLLVRSSLVASRFVGPTLDLKQITAEAEVDAVLTGTLLRTGDKIRVITQLVEAPSGTLIWSQTSQVGLDDVFGLEETLTRRVVESLSLPLTDREQKMLRRDVPASPSAYEFYLRGTQQGHGPEDWQVARDLFQRSVEEDPRYAPAWARLARCHWLVFKYTKEPGDSFQRAEESLKRAFELNPDLAFAHNLSAHIDVSAGRPLEAMQRLLARTRSHPTNPDLFAGLVLACRFCGLLEASEAAHREARQLDPGARTSITHTRFMQGDYEQALEDAHLDIGYMDLLILMMLGRHEEALHASRKTEKPSDRTHVGNWVTTMRALLEGQREECIAAMERLVASFRDPEGMFYVARTFAHLGESKRALEVFSDSVQGGFTCFPAFARDPWLDSLRTTPEFRDILLEAETRHRAAVAAFLEEGGERLLGVSVGH